MFHTFDRSSTLSYGWNVSKLRAHMCEIHWKYFGTLTLPLFSVYVNFDFSIPQPFLLSAFEIRTELASNGRKSFVDIILSIIK